MREITPKDRRQIFKRLDEVYDDKKGRYCDGFTDNSVAKELNMPRAWITEVRESNFGPDGGNDDMERVSAAVGKLAKQAKDLQDDAISLASRAEELEAEAGRIRAQISAIQQAVGPQVKSA